MEEKIKKLEREVKNLKDQLKSLVKVVELLKPSEVKERYIDMRTSLNNKNIDEELEIKLEYDTTVGFKSFEDIEKENIERKEGIVAANNILNGRTYKPTIAEEMNLNAGPDFIYLGKGSFN